MNLFSRIPYKKFSNPEIRRTVPDGTINHMAVFAATGMNARATVVCPWRDVLLKSHDDGC